MNEHAGNLGILRNLESSDLKFVVGVVVQEMPYAEVRRN